ncbi:MAG: hypothetical protein R2761_26930 [Acidimicrobiales bacterium]
MSAAETLDVNDGPSGSKAAPGQLSAMALRLEELTRELTEQQAELDLAAQALAEANRAQAVLERDRAVAEAQAAELARQLDQEREERSLLTTRLTALLSERDLAVASLGWWSRRRYQRRVSTRSLHPAGGAPLAGQGSATPAAT